MIAQQTHSGWGAGFNITHMFSVNGQQFRNCDIFREANAETIDYLCEQSTPVAYSRDRQIYVQGDNSTDFHLIVSGSVRAKGYSPDGKTVSYGDIGPGELFGEFAALDSNRRSSGIVAIDDVLALKLPAVALRTAIEMDGKVALNLIQSLVEKTRLQTERVFEFSVFAVQKRVQQEILRLVQNAIDNGGDVDGGSSLIIPIPTHQELADRLSTHREAVTRELRFLVKMGLIKSTRKGIEILDFDKLKHLVKDFGRSDGVAAS